MFKVTKFLPMLAVTTALSTAPVAAQDVEELKKQLAILAKKIEMLEQAQAKAATKAEATAQSIQEIAEKTAVAMKAPIVKKAEPAMRLATADGLFETDIRGRIFTDYVMASDRDGTMDLSGTEFRGARIGVQGKAWKDTAYKIEIEFEGNEVEVKDAYIDFKTGLGKVSVGQFKTPNSLSEATSGRHLAFTERGSFTDTFELGRQTGIKLTRGNDHYMAALGIYKGSMEDNGDNSFTVAGRATYGDAIGDGHWLIGGSFRYRDTDGSLRYRQKPHAHLTNRFLDTGALDAKDDFFYNAEAAIEYGSFYSAVEYGVTIAKDASLSRPGTNATLHGGYIDVGYFLTGEKRPLDVAKGEWGRPKVDNPVHKGGFGAISINGRYDIIDLTGDGIYGGEMDTWALGINWYLNRHSRIMANYSHSSITKAFNVSANGADGANSVDALNLRFQIDW